MNYSQLLLIIGGVVLSIFLYSLPRVVVENEADAQVESHDFSITDEDASAMQSLRLKVSSMGNEISYNFADSLARLYLKYGLVDSASHYTDLALARDSSLNTILSASEIYYLAFERAITQDQLRNFGLKSRKVLEKIVAIDSTNLVARTRLAMTLVTTASPMVGIGMLREVLEIDSEFRPAIINLGLMSIQSGQYDRGVERFQKLIDMDPFDLEAMLYLGICYKELRKNEMAKSLFEKIVDEESADPALKLSAQEYLEDLI